MLVRRGPGQAPFGSGKCADHRAGGHRDEIELLPVLEFERHDRVGTPTAGDVELALERLGHHDVRAAPDENLTDHRLGFLHRRRHRHVGVDRYVAPAEHHLALGADRTLDLLFTGQARSLLLGHEHHADPILSRRWQGHALPGHFLAIEQIGNLDENAGTIALQRVGTDRATMIEIFQDFQALKNDSVALATLDVSDKTHSTGIVFIHRVVQTLLLREIHHANPQLNVVARLALLRPGAALERGVIGWMA
jgi:hypothetical protein